MLSHIFGVAQVRAEMTALLRTPVAFRSSLSAVRSSSLRSKRSLAATSEGGVFGLRPPDYSVIPPIRASPPPPPAKPGLQKYLWAITVTFSAVTVGYFYMNNNNDNYEYWRAMQTGEALHIGDDDDDDEDDDED